MKDTGHHDRKFETLYSANGKSSLALGHPRYKGRADRLDLITNRMTGLKAAVSGKNFTVCDISETGFSYAEKVPVKKNLSFKQVKTKVDSIAVTNYGKLLKYICFFENETEKGGIEAEGTIKNHHIFLVLSDDEIKKTVTEYLQSKAIRRSHDPEGFFKKLDLLLFKSEDMRKRGYNESSLGVVMNTTFQNLVLEMGASAEIFDTLYQGYINKPVYVKYGVAVENHKEALSLIKFATVKNTARIKREDKEKEQNLKKKIALIKRFNKRYSYKFFISIVWKACLEHFKLDEDMDLPLIETESIAIFLKDEMALYTGFIERIVDPDFKEKEPKGLLQYITNGLYWHLIDIDKIYFDREVIKKDVSKVMLHSYRSLLSKEASQM
jgi:hypothetical protein